MLKFSAAAGVTVAAGISVAWAATGINYQQFGFPTVIAKTSIAAGQAATIKAGNAAITIPQGTFSDPVEFEVLQGPLASFAAKSPTGQTPLYDFAFKVTDAKTNTLVMAFQKPVVFSYTNSGVNSKSQYFNINTQGTYQLNPIPASVTGNTLTHKIAGAGVGWVVTSQATPVAAATSPITGLPLADWLYTGAGLMVAGGVALALRRKVS